MTPTLTLEPDQQAMLDGRTGWPQQVAMRLLVAVARAFDAPRLIPVASVHLSLSGVSVGEPGRRLFEDLVARGGRFVVPTSLNVLSLDRRTSAASAPPPDATQLAIARACETLGGRPTYSCNPFLLGIVPAPGESVAWNESATAPYINGVLGARTNREGATALASALTGYTAEYGMHVAAARRGGMAIEVDVPVAGADAFAVLGGAVGHACGARIPVIAGLRRTPTLDEFTAFCAALAAVSPVAMFHMVGITPEAPASLDGLGPAVRLDARALDDETARHSTATGERVDLVAVGCPHASLEQVEEVAVLVGDAHVAARHAVRGADQRVHRRGRRASPEPRSACARPASSSRPTRACTSRTPRRAPAPRWPPTRSRSRISPAATTSACASARSRNASRRG